MAQNLQSENATPSTNQLLQALMMEDKVARRKEVAEILKEFDDDKAVSLLFDGLLKSPHGESRRQIVEELAKIASAKAVETLGMITTHDFDPEVQREAVKALKQIGSNEAVDALLVALRAGEEWQRQRAAHALGEFHSDKVVDGLIEASKDPRVAGAAVLSLAQIGSDRVTDTLITAARGMPHGGGGTWYDAMEGLIRLGTEKAIDGLLQFWNSTDPIHRSRLFGILYQTKPNNLIVPLSQRLRNKTLPSEARATAAEVLGVIGTETEVPLLEAVWREHHGEVGRSALRAAERISHRELKMKAERERVLEETRAFVAHEFRHALTPLNAYVKMLDEALTKTEIDKEKLSSLAARIRRQTDTAFDLVNQYLDYSHPLSPQLARTDVSGLLRQILEEFSAELEKRNIVVRLDLAEGASVEADDKMLAQVFRNVVANAVQAIGNDGSLVITTRFGDGGILITVRDTGAGIRPEHLPHVFEIGFTTKSGARGAGIGLALSKRIIEEAHHGHMTIANNEDGPGATVLITLPKKRMETEDGRHGTALADRGR